MKHRREILAIAIPAIVTNITTPLLSLVDVAVTGHIGEAVYIGAIALGGTLFNTLYWLFNFLRMGTTGLTAQAYGAAGRDSRARDIILFRSLAVGLVVGVVLLLLSPFTGNTVLSFMDSDDNTKRLAMQYFKILIWGAPAVMLTYGLSGWFLGMQDSRAQMWMAITTNVVNIAISPVLVFGFGMRIAGVAVGTLVAQWTGLLIGVAIVWRRYRPQSPGLQAIFRADELLKFFRINIDIFLRTACLVAVTLWFTHAGALQGTDILAANALLLQLFMLFSYFMDGFAFAGEALAGKYAGLGDSRSLLSLIRSLMRIGLLFALVFSAVYMLLGEEVLRMLAKDVHVVETARRYLVFAALVPICGFMAFVWDGIFVGLVRTRAMLMSMAGAIAVFFIIYFAAHRSAGNSALWTAFNAYLMMRGVLEYLFYRFKRPAV